MKINASIKWGSLWVMMISSCQNSNEHDFVYDHFYLTQNNFPGNPIDEPSFQTMCDIVTNTTSIAIATFDTDVTFLPEHCSDDSTVRVKRRMYTIDTLAGPHIPEEILLEHHSYFPNFKTGDLFLVKVYIIDNNHYFAGIAPISVSLKDKDSTLETSIPDNTQEFSLWSNYLLTSNLKDTCPNNLIQTPEEMHFYYIGYWSRPCPTEDKAEEVPPIYCGDDGSQCEF